MAALDRPTWCVCWHLNRTGHYAYTDSAGRPHKFAYCPIHPDKEHK